MAAEGAAQIDQIDRVDILLPDKLDRPLSSPLSLQGREVKDSILGHVYVGVAS